MFFKTSRMLLVVSLLTLAIGCNSEETKLPVSGTVMLDGKPLPDVNVMMIREDGTSMMATTDSSGSFSRTTDGVPAGIYKIGITPNTELISSDLAGTQPPAKTSFAPKYMSADTSGLTITVAKDLPPVELALTSK